MINKLTALACDDSCCDHFPFKDGDLYDREEVDGLVKELEQQNEALVTMVKVFKACIETGVYPIKDSPCYEKINELIGGEK